jgi:hypothetical protein
MISCHYQFHSRQSPASTDKVIKRKAGQLQEAFLNTWRSISQQQRK